MRRRRCPDKPLGGKALHLRVYDGRNVPSGKDSVSKVASTIFPYRFYPPSLSRQDFYGRTVTFLARLRRRGREATPSSPPISAIVRDLLNASGTVSYFGLHKLFYEYEHCRCRGQ